MSYTGPQSFIFIGRSGCGKGTQVELLTNLIKKRDPKHKILHVETGAELRAFSKESSYTAKITKDTIDSGNLVPVYMTVFMWARILADKFTGKEHLFFDGTPRKLLEAETLDAIFPFYKMDKPWVIYLDVKHEEAKTRLLKRGRTDDTYEGIDNRMKYYEAEVAPAVKYYTTHRSYHFIDVNGEQSIEAVHADIVKAIGLE